MTSYIKFLQANVRNMIPVVKDVFMKPAAAAVDSIKTATVYGSGTVNITTFAAQPAPPRKLQLVLVDDESAVQGSLTITGKDMMGKTISEVVEMDIIPWTSVYVTTKAYAQVTSIVGTLSGASKDDATLSVGVTNDLQLTYKCCLSDDILREEFNGALVATTGKMDHAANTYAVVSTLNGTADLVVYYKRR